MIKYFFALILSAVVLTSAKAQITGKTVTYYKYVYNNTVIVNSLKEADFYQLTFPADNNDSLFNTEEYYKNGNKKFIGQYVNNPDRPGTTLLSGYCVYFYPNGKRRLVVNYSNGYKTGLEYYYRTNGHLEYVKKYDSYRIGKYQGWAAFWECYDLRDSLICREGQGKWLIYDNQGKDIIFQGSVKDGLMDGEWKGYLGPADPIKFTCFFRNGALIRNSSQDPSSGQTCTFNYLRQNAVSKVGPIGFLQSFRSHLTLPKDNNGKPIQIDTLKISFFIEKDGKITGVVPVGIASDDLKAALTEAANKCSAWYPSKILGVPYRTKFVLPVKFFEGLIQDDSGMTFEQRFQYFIQILDFKSNDNLVKISNSIFTDRDGFN